MYRAGRAPDPQPATPTSTSSRADEMRATRGDLDGHRARTRPWRERPTDENLALFREMREGKLADGVAVLRAKIDMASAEHQPARPGALPHQASPTHHNTGDAWCIYPMYTYAHPIEDALENITHSICTLEFEDQRPFYDWLLERTVPVLRAPQFRAMRDRLQALATAGLEAKREFALRCRNIAAEKPDKLGFSRYERRVEAMFASWTRNPDLAASDADEFLKLLATHTECFTPLLQHAFDDASFSAVPNPFMLPHQHEFKRLNADLHRHQQAQAAAARRREASSTAGTTRACPRSSACAGAATRPRRSSCCASASA